MTRRDLISGLDIGTSKVCAVVAEAGERPRVLGVGVAPCEGVRKGVVANADRTTEAIVAAIAEVERASGVKVEEAAVGVGGDHILGENARSVIAVSRQNGEIREQDAKRVVEAARSIDLPDDRVVLHAVTQGFVIDGERPVRDPRGATGVRLEGHVHMVTGATAAIQAITRCARRAGIRVRRHVILPYASSFAVLSPDEVERGVALIDVGAGTTGIALFSEGAVRSSCILPLGGNHITNDISIGLHTSVADAERLKVRSAHAVPSAVAGESALRVPGAGSEERTVTPETLGSIVAPRITEMLEFAAAELRESEHYDRLGSGIVLTGGTSLLPGIADVAERVFEMPVRIGAPVLLDGLSETVAGPRFAAVIGLVLYGLGSERGERAALVTTVSTKVESISRAVTQVKDWLNDFF